MKNLPKLQTDDDTDLIDEDSLLSGDDLKKPQIPPGRTTRLFKPHSLFLVFGCVLFASFKRFWRHTNAERGTYLPLIRG